MRHYKILLFGNLINKEGEKREIYSITLVAKEWSIVKNGGPDGPTVVKFSDGNGSIIAVFKWENIIGVIGGKLAEDGEETYEQE